MTNRFDLPDLGLGVGLRTAHFSHLLDQPAPVGWFELVSENFMDNAGRPFHVAETLRRDHPLVLHGVSMSIGSTDPLDLEYLRGLKRLADRLEVAWMGDHVCWTGVQGRNGHDLYPMPYTDESLRWIVQRIKVVQDLLERPLVLENTSTYLQFRSDTIAEVDFIAAMAEEADCALLLDVNNVYVTCRNHGLDAHAYIDALPLDRVVQIHIAGHTDNDTHCVDTHDHPVRDEVWALYARTMAATGRTSTLLEWDDHIPPFEELVAEVEKARQYLPGQAP